MKTTVTVRGLRVIPAEVRTKYRIRPGQALQWVDEGGDIRLIPLPEDPIAALRGRAKGQQLTRRLLASRRADSERDRSR